MERLTNVIEDKTVYYKKGVYAPTTLCAEMTTSEVRECMSKLAEYEDLGMTPSEIKKRFKSVKIRMVNQFDGCCPNCNELLIMGSRKYRHCYVCGKLLDWRND